MAATATKPMVPGGGIEPPTRGFSIPAHPNKNSALACKRSVDSPGTNRDSVNGMAKTSGSRETCSFQYLLQVQPERVPHFSEGS